MKVDIKVIIIVVMSIVLMGNQGFFDDDEVGRYELFRDNVSGGKLYMVDTKKGESIRVHFDFDKTTGEYLNENTWTHTDYVNHKVTHKTVEK